VARRLCVSVKFVNDMGRLHHETAAPAAKPQGNPGFGTLMQAALKRGGTSLRTVHGWGMPQLFQGRSPSNQSNAARLKKTGF
jgi:hypothetical protein